MCWKLKNIATNMTRSSIYTVKNMIVPAAEFAIWKIIVTVRMYPSLNK
jgi:hypothetical protein